MSFDPLPTAALADACARLGVPTRAVALKALLPGRPVAGPALAVRHAGSVDVFFEALQSAMPGQVLVIDNGGRLDEGCIGDLTALEAMHHGVAAIIVDGAHRDTAALRELGLPVWSRAFFPFGPRAARPRPADALRMANIAGFAVQPGDVIAADDDGVVVVPQVQAERVWALARKIVATEGEQARLAKSGAQPLCEQFALRDYLAKRSTDPTIGFRAHLRTIGKAIEE